MNLQLPSSDSSRGGLAAAMAGLIVLLAFSAWVGYRGIEFGEHWDEPKLQAALANAFYTDVTLADGTHEHHLQLLPHWYNYPSLGFDIAAASMSLDALEVMQGRRLAHADQDSVLSELHDRAFPEQGSRKAEWKKLGNDFYDPVRSRLRAIFLFISLLSGVGAFALAWLLDRSPLEALLAGAITLLGWEFGYHARWIAPDGLLTTFCLLSVVLLMGSLRARRPWPWMIGATIAAGLTVSSKYTGGVILLPLLGVAALHCWREGEALGPQLRRLVPIWAMMVLGFLLILFVTSPGLLIEPLKAFSDINFERRHYSTYGHRGHNTTGFADHAQLLGHYAATQLLSHYEPIAIFLIALAAIGAIVALLRRPLAQSLLLLFIPVFFPLYLMSQKVMMVRNVMVVIPFLGVLAAIAVGETYRLLRGRATGGAGLIISWVVPAACVIALASNAYWAWHASQTIVDRHAVDLVAEFKQFAEDHPERSFVVSTRLAKALGATIPTTQPHTAKSGGEPWLAFYKSELESDIDAAESNHFAYQLLPTGPYEVNLTYYASWGGPDRIVMVRQADISGHELGRMMKVK